MRAIGNWSKNEIDLSKEKRDFDSLDEAGRHIYESGLKSLYYIRSKDRENKSEEIVTGCDGGACAI